MARREKFHGTPGQDFAITHAAAGQQHFVESAQVPRGTSNTTAGIDPPDFPFAVPAIDECVIDKGRTF